MRGLFRRGPATLGPRPPFTALASANNLEAMFKRFTPILALTALCWAVFVVNNLLLNGRFEAYGITPRQLGSLPGILWAPFLHASFRHLAANTLPLLILGGILCRRSWGEFAVVTVLGIGLGGGLTWLAARPACHIGASGLIFCYFGYLASLAVFRRTFGTLCLSLVCLLGYGGILRGVLPTSAAISWEGHAAGLLVGVALAWFISKLDKTPAQSPLPSTAAVTEKWDQ
jgi:membrane associated rhomboid family serine protease